MFLYLDRRTLLHGLSPITKMVGLLLLFAAPLCTNRPFLLIGPLGVVLVLTALSRAWIHLRRILPFLLLLLLFSLVLWTFLYRGAAAGVHLGPLRLSKESVLYGLGMGMRLDTMLLVGMIFLSVTRVEEFTAGLNRMGLPFAVCFALSLAFRLVPLFLSEVQTVVEAQRARGLEIDTGTLFARVRKYVPLLVPTLVLAIRHTDLLSMALEGKGFGAQPGRSSYLQVHMKGRDYGALAVLIAVEALWIGWLVRM